MAYATRLYRGFALVAAAGLFTACQQSASEGGEAEGGGELKSIVGTDESIDVEYFVARWGERQADFNTAFNAVARLEMGGLCTGFFISDKYLMTNQHCVESASPKPTHPPEKNDAYTRGLCERLVIRLDHQTADTQARAMASFAAPVAGEIRCKAIHIANQTRDVAIVEVRSPVNVRPLKIARSTPIGQNVIVVGHPSGVPKKISYRNGNRYCVASQPSYPPGKGPLDTPNLRYGQKFVHSFVHDCDTLGGSSGSPVLSLRDFSVVGLHWDGWKSSKWPYYDANGRQDNPNDSTDDSAEHNDLPIREGNVGIKIEDIRALMTSTPGLPEDLVALFR